jgi:hypothetical protein
MRHQGRATTPWRRPQARPSRKRSAAPRRPAPHPPPRPAPAAAPPPRARPSGTGPRPGRPRPLPSTHGRARGSSCCRALHQARQGGRGPGECPGTLPHHPGHCLVSALGLLVAADLEVLAPLVFWGRESERRRRKGSGSGAGAVLRPPRRRGRAGSECFDTGPPRGPPSRPRPPRCPLQAASAPHLDGLHAGALALGARQAQHDLLGGLGLLGAGAAGSGRGSTAR